MNTPRNLTAAQEVLLAAGDLHKHGHSEFSEWDLSVAAWERNQNRFGCRGYESRFPDHKRVMMEIMGVTKKENPLRQGWLKRTRTNHYRITDVGLAEVARLEHMQGTNIPHERSAQVIYDAVVRYVFHPVFRKHLSDPEEPRTWLGVQAFLGLAKNDPTVLDDALRTADNAVAAAIGWLDESGRESLRTGPSGGKKTILKSDLEKLPPFMDLLKSRFQRQIEAIRRQRT